ncbi:hypothetical protein STEG23_034958 [Scotinomys teguina]
MEVVAAAPRCQLLLIMLATAMLLPGLKVSPLLVRRKIIRTIELQENIGKVIQALGEHLKLRQQVIATATVYFKRFYARYSLKSIDPVLMAPTCVFLASKVEEFGVVSNTRLIAATTSVLKTRFSYAFPKEFPYRMNHILECEFYLLELMDCCLIVYHPYRPLLQYVQDMGQEDVLLPLAWRIVNDTYRTDLCLLYPPFMIALACLHVACVVQQKDARQWFAELSVDMEKVFLPAYVSLRYMHAWCPKKPEEGIRSLGTGITDSYAVPRGCWESNLDPLALQTVLFSIE